jgi:hypothetical protein
LNLHEDGTFSVNSMYEALIQPKIPVDNKKNIWKMKLPLKTKISSVYFRRGVTSPNIILLSETGMGLWSRSCVFCQEDETIKHLILQCYFARSIWAIIQLASDLYPPRSVANISSYWLPGIDHRFRTLIR